MIQALTLQGRGGRAVELFDLLNPILAATAPNGEEVYRAEPYVVAADVYSTPPHVGRGGWTWYTGSAAWMYRVALNSFWGCSCAAIDWRWLPAFRPPGPSINSRYVAAIHAGMIRVLNPDAIESGRVAIVFDGELQPIGSIPLAEDGQDHDVVVTLQKTGSVNVSRENGAVKVAAKRPGR